MYRSFLTTALVAFTLVGCSDEEAVQAANDAEDAFKANRESMSPNDRCIDAGLVVNKWRLTDDSMNTSMAIATEIEECRAAGMEPLSR